MEIVSHGVSFEKFYWGEGGFSNTLLRLETRLLKYNLLNENKVFVQKRTTGGRQT